MATGPEMERVVLAHAEEIEHGLDSAPGLLRAEGVGPVVVNAVKGQQGARRDERLDGVLVEGEPIRFPCELGESRVEPEVKPVRVGDGCYGVGTYFFEKEGKQRSIESRKRN